MSISGKQTINIGLPNESTGSDSLYTAFTKAQDNFDVLFLNASPYTVFTAGMGISTTNTASNGTVVITNTGVTSLIQGTGISISSANGDITISSTGGNGNGSGGTVTYVGVSPVSNTRLTVTGSPVVSEGNIFVDLATSGVTLGTYANPTLTVDTYGRVTSASNGLSSGTVTSIGLTPGPGIQINGGPITSNGNITVTNIGVTRLNQGSGIALSGSNGNVTISATSLGGTVTQVGIASSQLVISGSPVVSSGTINVNLPDSATFTGNVATGNLSVTSELVYNPTFGSFFSNVSQTNSVANTAMSMTLNNTFSANNVSIVSSSRITFAKAGAYNIGFRAQVEKTTAGIDELDIWLSKNGNSVNNTNTTVGLVGTGAKQVASWSWEENVAAGDYYEIKWSSPSLAAQITYAGTKTSPARPATPSVIVTVSAAGS